MARPIDFKESNLKWVGEGVGDLPAYRQDGINVSKWQLSEEELAEIAETGIIWLHVHADRHPPVSIQTESPFQGGDDAEGSDGKGIDREAKGNATGPAG